MVAGGSNMPEADIEISEALVRRLLDSAVADQNLDPGLAGRELRLSTNGWDNVLYRLGDDLVVRLPRRKVAVPLVVNEQRWLPVVAAALPIPVPTPVFCGQPCAVFDKPWSIVPWFAGDSLALAPLDDAEADRLAHDLARFLHALHRPAPDDAPKNPPWPRTRPTSLSCSNWPAAPSTPWRTTPDSHPARVRRGGARRLKFGLRPNVPETCRSVG